MILILSKNKYKNKFKINKTKLIFLIVVENTLIK